MKDTTGPKKSVCNAKFVCKNPESDFLKRLYVGKNGGLSRDSKTLKNKICCSDINLFENLTLGPPSWSDVCSSNLVLRANIEKKPTPLTHAANSRNVQCNRSIGGGEGQVHTLNNEKTQEISQQYALYLNCEHDHTYAKNQNKHTNIRTKIYKLLPSPIKVHSKNHSLKIPLHNQNSKNSTQKTEPAVFQNINFFCLNVGV